MQVILREEILIVQIMCSFHSSTLLGLFTRNKAYALFPKSTFSTHKEYLLKRDEAFCAAPWAKYRRIRWLFRDGNGPEPHDPYQPIQETRCIGVHSRTWIIPFAPTDIEGTAPNYVLEYSEFSCDLHPKQPDEGLELYLLMPCSCAYPDMKHQSSTGEVSGMST